MAYRRYHPLLHSLLILTLAQTVVAKLVYEDHSSLSGLGAY